MLRRMLCVSYISGMSGNTFGKSLVLTTYGESHGDQIGGILDGMPAGIAIDIAEVQRELDRRKPGQSALTPLLPSEQSTIWSAFTAGFLKEKLRVHPLLSPS